jgi:selenocysteine lyase/cysteine desulfurase
MSLTRRELLAGTAQLAAASVASLQTPGPDGRLPAARDFAIPAGQTYLNSAFIHPIPIAAANAVTRYIESRSFSRERWSGDDLAAKVRAQFASLINAKAGEISLVESTSRGENLVVNGLGLGLAALARRSAEGAKAAGPRPTRP